MPLRIYRVCRARYAVLNGEGAKRVGGRWNSPGRAVVDMAGSVALAVLENLVHLSRQDFPTGYVVIGALVPEDIRILSLDEAADPQQAGDKWFDSQESAVLRVNSVVVRGDSNFLLNPTHPDFSRITVEAAKPFEFDPRLFS
ncbi:MAG: RES domain-containing protein [Bryobacteraceae bacterium]|nr:RES domain-containing protein [Bryobacteraceae bacterium]